jgi:FkbM family methyltransferase
MDRRPFDATKFPLLNAVLDEAGIKLVDIGGRGSAFPWLLPLARFSSYYACEPDREEAERLRQHLPLRAPWRSVTVIAEAIAAKRGEATLFMTKEAGMSSLLEPDAAVTGRFCLAGKFTVASAATVRTLPLDAAAAQYEFGDACFLKLDTQGTELEILRSGARLVRESILGVHVECSFRAFYKAQGLFSDVDSHLRDNGFALFSLSRTNLRRAGYRPTLYSRRVTVWAHCLYLREPDTLLTLHRQDLRRQMSRLLGLALAFEQFDLALEITALICRVGILSEPDAYRLADEVRRKCRDSTRHSLRTAQSDSLADDMTAESFRDKDRSE